MGSAFPLSGLFSIPCICCLQQCLGDSDPLGVSFLTVLSGSPSLYSMRVVVHLLLVLVLLVRALSSSHYVVYVLGCLCAISVGNLIPNLLGYSYL